MIRLATRADLPAILAIRDGAGDAPLSDPDAVTEADASDLIDAGTLWVSQEANGAITGFAGVDARDGLIRALLVKPGHEGKGIGRALLAIACDAARVAGCGAATIRLPPAGGAARQYRAAGWTANELIFRKAL